MDGAEEATQMHEIAEKCHDSGMHVFSFDLPAHGESSSKYYD
ncbi:MAG: hypothetical protein ACJZZ7_04110 [Cytophagales bacterium]